MELDGYPAIPAFYFDARALRQLADKHRDAYRSADPYPHIVLDGLVPDAILDRVAREIPSPDRIRDAWRADELPSRPEWDQEGAPSPGKLGTSDEGLFGAFTRHFIAQLNSHAFLDFIERLTGIEHLVTDPTYASCGLHSTGPGGKLSIHTDASRHPNQSCHQRINVIYYLNHEWQESWGGHLEMWDPAATRCVRRVLPVFNRCLIFTTDRDSNHGHPHPLACPPDRRRNSLAVYYYTFQTWTSHQQETTFHAVTGQELRYAWRNARTLLSPRAMATKLVPPIAWDAVRLVRSMWPASTGEVPAPVAVAGHAPPPSEPPRMRVPELQEEATRSKPSTAPLAETPLAASAASEGQASAVVEPSSD